jgi:DNA topoisomerase-1
LLAYREHGGWHELSAEEVNDYMKAISGDLHGKGLPYLERNRARGRRHRRARARGQKAVKTVAAYLGNTPSVCRASYIDPRVVDRFQAGATIAPALKGRPTPDLSNPRMRTRVEPAVLDLLDETT